MLSLLKRQFGKIWKYGRLPLAAKREIVADRQGLPAQDPGIDRVIEEGVAWLGRAQDHSPSRDGGVARHFSLVDGWGSSYPETTGYIVPTLLAYADQWGGDAGEDARQRARRMLDWLVSIQFPEGGFQGGLIDSEPKVPVTFNTGQILLGLASGLRACGDVYREPMRRRRLAGQDPGSRRLLAAIPDPLRGARREGLRDPRRLGIARSRPGRGSGRRALCRPRPSQRPLGPRPPAGEWLVRPLLPDRRGPTPDSHDRLRAPRPRRGLPLYAGLGCSGGGEKDSRRSPDRHPTEMDSCRAGSAPIGVVPPPGPA